jgi:hypothetical protein
MALGRVKVFCAILARGHVRWLDFALLPPLLPCFSHSSFS